MATSLIWKSDSFCLDISFKTILFQRRSRSQDQNFSFINTIKLVGWMSSLLTPLTTNHTTAGSSVIKPHSSWETFCRIRIQLGFKGNYTRAVSYHVCWYWHDSDAQYCHQRKTDSIDAENPEKRAIFCLHGIFIANYVPWMVQDLSEWREMSTRWI